MATPSTSYTADTTQSTSFTADTTIAMKGYKFIRVGSKLVQTAAGSFVVVNTGSGDDPLLGDVTPPTTHTAD